MMPDLPPLLKAALQLRAETDLSRLFLPAMTTPNRPPLSPAAQAVMDHFLADAEISLGHGLAAAFRAAADQIKSSQQDYDEASHELAKTCLNGMAYAVYELRCIANELGPVNENI